MTSEPKVVDLTIIGGGPTGLFVAYYAGLRQMSVKIVESLPQLGGQLSALYPEKYIYDIAGLPKIRAKKLIDNLIAQLKGFPPDAICLNESVQKLEKRDDGTLVLTTNMGEHFSKAIIIAAGNGAFQHKKIGLKDEAIFEKTNLHYFIDDLKVFTNQKVLVLGGGDSAVDWALMLEPIAKEVSITHRRDRFRAHEASTALLKESSVQVLTPYVPVRFIGEERIEQVVLQELTSEKEIVVEVDAVLVNYGFLSTLGSIKDWGLNIEKNSIVVNSKMETNMEGVYAVGDINTYDGKVKLIATGFGEAPIAVSNAKVYIDPTAKVQPLHSTSVMEKRETEVQSI